MNKTFLLAIGVVLCVTPSAKETHENAVIISEKELKNHIKVDIAVNKEFNFNASRLKDAQEEECKCENGQCMRECDVDKTKPCDDQKQVCVCPPEFAREHWVEDKCRFCDCGLGINCTFSYINDKSEIVADCKCPKGYYTEYYPEGTRCLTECSDEQPCQYGGRCYDGKCSCPWRTMGDLCKEIPECKSKCLNKFEVDCIFSPNHYAVYCNCKNPLLFFDQETNICKPCPCGENGICDYEYGYKFRKLVCKCKSGYKIFKGYCKKCDCGLGSKCEFDSKGDKICRCDDGYYEREGRCVSCGCTRYNNSGTKCEVTGNEKRCFCPFGYQEVNGFCEEINECEGDHECHPSTTCNNTFGGYECRCPDGYRGPNGAAVGPREVCEDIDECQELYIPCRHRNNEECVNLPGSYKCECLPGYQPSSFSVEPHETACMKATKSMVPMVIAVSTSLVLMAVSCLMHILVKMRATSLN